MSVEFLDPEPNGLSQMVGDLIAANLKRDPGRRALLKPGAIHLTASDAGVSTTIRLRLGGVAIANGQDGVAQIRVRADSALLLSLTSVPLRMGLPDPFAAAGRRLIGGLLAREIRISGLIRHSRTLIRLSRLLSVA